MTEKTDDFTPQAYLLDTLGTAERSILGSILISPEITGEVLTRIGFNDFVTPKYRHLFQAAAKLYNDGTPIDPVTVLDAAGHGYDKIIQDCMDMTPTAANVFEYARILKEQSALYRLHGLGDALREAANMDAARELVEQAGAVLTDRPGVECLSMAELLTRFFARQTAKPDYIKFGLPALDSTLYVERGSYVLIAARPSTGKTALALQLGCNIAKERRVGFFSFEAGEGVIGDRAVANLYGAKFTDIKRRTLDESARAALMQQVAKSDAVRLPFEFLDCPGMTVQEIRAWTLAHRYDVIIIDYIQLIRPSIRGDRAEQMQQVSMELRELAKTGVTVIGLAQLRRADRGSESKSPTMSDLKESGQFEQDADVILLMYLKDPDNRASDRYLKVEKNKEGYAGIRCQLRFDGNRQRFDCRVDDKTEEPVKSEKKPVFKELTGVQGELPF